MSENITGVILAGGKSSRMGKDKATLMFNGKPMVSHMAELLVQAGIDDIVISGPSSYGTGLRFIPDEAEHHQKGPGKAILNCLSFFPRGHGVLFVPVDMPLLGVSCLRQLVVMPQGACFLGHPLPIFIPNNRAAYGNVGAVRDIMNLFSIREITLQDKQNEMTLLNANTPEEWEIGVSYERQA